MKSNYPELKNDLEYALLVIGLDIDRFERLGFTGLEGEKEIYMRLEKHFFPNRKIPDDTTNLSPRWRYNNSGGER